MGGRPGNEQHDALSNAIEKIDALANLSPDVESLARVQPVAFERALRDACAALDRLAEAAARSNADHLLPAAITDHRIELQSAGGGAILHLRIQQDYDAPWERVLGWGKVWANVERALTAVRQFVNGYGSGGAVGLRAASRIRRSITVDIVEQRPAPPGDSRDIG